jgi:hypothetical protein
MIPPAPSPSPLTTQITALVISSFKQFHSCPCHNSMIHFSRRIKLTDLVIMRRKSIIYLVNVRHMCALIYSLINEMRSVFM